MFLIEDDWKKEGKKGIALLIFCIVMIIITVLSEYKKTPLKDIIFNCSFYFLCGAITLYCILYSIKYKVKISNEKILLKTLFRKREVNINEIKYYTCKRYRKSVFYQFWLYLDGKKVLINTRYKDEFKEILNQNEIIEQTK